jgi:catechol 2,3-dioxygenase-like lactoylglutathione lyase family enzyme
LYPTRILEEYTQGNRKESGDDMVEGAPAWSVRSVLVSVTDLDNSIAFYKDVMNLRDVLRQDRMAALSLDEAGTFTLYLRHAPNGSHPGQQAVGVRSLVYDVGEPAVLDYVEEQLRALDAFRSRHAMSNAHPFELVNGHDPDRLPLTFMALGAETQMSLDDYCRVMTAMYSVDV